jgi:hypothetical protein
LNDLISRFPHRIPLGIKSKLIQAKRNHINKFFDKIEGKLGKFGGGGGGGGSGSSSGAGSSSGGGGGGFDDFESAGGNDGFSYSSGGSGSSAGAGGQSYSAPAPAPVAYNPQTAPQPAPQASYAEQPVSFLDEMPTV